MGRAMLAAGGLFLPPWAHAIGTAAGTEIRNQAEITFVLDGATLSRSSNASTLRVLELLDVNLLVQTPERLVDAGAAAEPLLFTLTNTGNGLERFELRFDDAVAGDDFDPAAPAAAIYFDTDASGTLTAADVAYVPGVNEPELAADRSIDLLLVADIPAGIADGAHGASQLRAAAVGVSGSPGDLLPGRGDGGVDALLGTSGARAASIGRYLVGGVSLSVLKSAAITDRAGGHEPSPGATIVYTVRVSAVGRGVAAGAAFHDAIPQHTTYVAGSLAFNGAPLTDDADADRGEFVASAAELVVALGDLVPAGGAQEVKFAVTID